MLTKSKVTILIFLANERSKELLRANSASGTGQISWHTFIPSLVQLCELGMVITSILEMKNEAFWGQRTDSWSRAKLKLNLLSVYCQAYVLNYSTALPSQLFSSWRTFCEVKTPKPESRFDKKLQVFIWAIWTQEHLLGTVSLPLHLSPIQFN